MDLMSEENTDLWISFNVPSVDQSIVGKLARGEIRLSSMAPDVRPRFRAYLDGIKAMRRALSLARDTAARERERVDRVVVEDEFTDWRHRLYERLRRDGYQTKITGSRRFTSFRGQPVPSSVIENEIRDAFMIEFDVVINDHECRRWREEFQVVTTRAG